MKPVLTLVVSFVALFSVSALASETRGGLPRIELQANVEVSGATIFLSDLLSQDAPDYAREEAARIPLGMAPQPGSARVLMKARIHSAIDRAGLPGNIFTIPDCVT